MTRHLQIGIVHPGEMGISIAASARNSGCEVAWASEGRSTQTASRAAAHGLTDLKTLPALARHCSLILSVCPPHAAEEVARSVLDTGFQGVFVDANAIAPERAVTIGRLMESRGVSFVDGGIIGEPVWEAGTTWLHLSGPKVEEVAACFRAGPLETADLGESIGRAPALKMCFAANTKGTTALLAAILGAADRLGVREPLERQWNAKRPGQASEIVDRVCRVTPKAWRFAGEMDEISATFSAAGMPGQFHQAAGRVYRRLEHFKGARSTPTLPEVLASLGPGDRHPVDSGRGRPPARFRIAPATESDIPALLELIRGLADYERLSEGVAATPEDLKAALLGPRPAAEALIGFAGTEAVGMAVFFQIYSTFLARRGLHLEDLYVKPEWRGQGLGDMLLSHVAALAVARDCVRLEWSVLDWNAPAIAFYQERGAAMLDQWRLCRVTGAALEQLAAGGPSPCGEE